MTGRPAVFLDRDGVLNRSFARAGVPTPPRRVDELELLPGVVEACATFAGAGLLMVVVTNQPDVRRGTLDPDDLAAINARLCALLPLDDVRVCPHDDGDGCGCRKPLPGLILDAARDHGVDLSRSVMVGDRWRDVEAARNAGVPSVGIARSGQMRDRSDPDFTFPSLAAAAEHIVALTEPGVTG